MQSKSSQIVRAFHNGRGCYWYSSIPSLRHFWRLLIQHTVCSVTLPASFTWPSTVIWSSVELVNSLSNEDAGSSHPWAVSNQGNPAQHSFISPVCTLVINIASAPTTTWRGTLIQTWTSSYPSGPESCSTLSETWSVRDSATTLQDISAAFVSVQANEKTSQRANAVGLLVIDIQHSWLTWDSTVPESVHNVCCVVALPTVPHISHLIEEREAAVPLVDLSFLFLESLLETNSL